MLTGLEHKTIFSASEIEKLQGKSAQINLNVPLHSGPKEKSE
jgi:hypothetical protein